MEIDEICKGCEEAEETIEHMLFYCKKPKTIWRLSPNNWEGINYLSQDFRKWWKKVYILEKQDINQSRVELTPYMLWGI